MKQKEKKEQLTVNVQYIKDLSFEIAGAKAYFLLDKNIKNFQVNFDIKSQKINQNVIEVDTTLYLSSKLSVEN